MSAGPFAFAIAVTTSGLVTYMKKSDGGIFAEYNTITNEEVEKAQISGDKDIMQETKRWSRSENITCKCDKDSTLAAYAWGDKVMIFHTYEEMPCYWVHEPFNPSLSCTDANRVPLPLPKDKNYAPRAGAQLVVTGDSKAENITLFYEDRAGYLLCRLAKSLAWDQDTRVVKVGSGSGLGGESWYDNKSIRVYYQDDKFVVQEFCLINNTWKSGATISTEPKSAVNIASRRWVGTGGVTELRVYFQVGESRIKEKCWTSGKGWWGDDVIIDAFPASFAVLTFYRGVSSDPVISVWAVSESSRVLLQKTFNSGNGWMGPLYIGLPRTYLYGRTSQLG